MRTASVGKNKFYKLAGTIFGVLLLATLLGMSAPQAWGAPAGSRGTMSDEGLAAYAEADAVDESRTIRVDADAICQNGLSATVQPILDQIRDQDDGAYWKVVIPEGKWGFEAGKAGFYVYSNTIIDCRGNGADDSVTISSGQSDAGALLRAGRKTDAANGTIAEAGGYDDYRNIMVLGGTWTARKDDGSFASGVNIKFGHASNIKLVGMTALDNRDAHHVELGGVNGVIVTDCLFSGYHDDGSLEAIQLDVVHRDADNFAAYWPYDDLATVNALVKNNTFRNVRRCVGSHHIVLGSHYDNIVIEHNLCENIADKAILAEYFTNSVIRDNDMVNVNSGVLARSMLPPTQNGQRGQTYIANAATSYPVETLAANLTISGNRIGLNGSAAPFNSTDKFGIRIAGDDVTSNNCSYVEPVTQNEQYASASVTRRLSVGSYFISAVTVENNAITLAQAGSAAPNINAGIRLANVKNSQFRGNTIDLGGCDKADGTGRGVVVSKCHACAIANNTIKGLTHAGCGGIQIINGGSGSTFSGNTIAIKGSIGIRVSATSVAGITGNTVSGYTSNGILLTDNAKCTGNISSNTLTGNKTSVCFGINIAGSAATTISKNTIKGSNQHGIYVHANNGKQAPVASIASNSISGVNAEGIFVNGTAAGTDITANTISNPGGNGVNINSSTVEMIRHNTISNYVKDGIVVTNSGKVANTIYNNTITGKNNTGFGIRVAGSNVTTINKNSIKGKSCHGIYITVFNNARSTVTTIKNCVVSGATSDGIRLNSSNVTNIAGNSIVAPGAAGIDVNKSTVARIKENTISNYAKNGILLIDGAKVTDTIYKNVLTGKTNNSLGINLVGCRAKIISTNTVKGHNLHGMYFHANGSTRSTVTTLYNNKVLNAKNDGIFIAATTVSNMKANTITSCQRFAVNVNTKSTVSRSEANSFVKNGKNNKPRVENGSAALFSTKAKLAIKKGKTFNLASSLIKSGDSTSVTYSSAKAKTASVTAKGVVKGVAKGQTTVTVKKGKASLVMDVTVS